MSYQHLQIINFIKFCEGLKNNLRHNWTSSGRQESVAEHSWRMSLFLLICAYEFDLEIDLPKALIMTIIHDLDELIGGDIPGFEKTQQDSLDEIKKAEQVFDHLPDLSKQNLIKIRKEYEEQVSIESRLVKAIDRIESQLQHQQSGIKFWSKKEVGDHMLNYPNQALDNLTHNDINQIWQLIKSELEAMTEEWSLKVSKNAKL